MAGLSVGSPASGGGVGRCYWAAPGLVRAVEVALVWAIEPGWSLVFPQGSPREFDVVGDKLRVVLVVLVPFSVLSVPGVFIPGVGGGDSG